MASQSVFKRWSRRLRLAWYLRRHGGAFDFHGIAVQVPDDISFAVKKGLMLRHYEEPERQLIERFMRSDLPVIELGGSLGIISAFVNQRLDAGLNYTIVEANPRLLGICRANATTTGNAGRIDVVHAACAYHASSISFMVSDNIHANRIAHTGGTNTITVPAVTLTDLVARKVGMSAYTLIMDIEGAEWDVFENDREALARCALVVAEVHPFFFAEQGRTLEGFMALVEAAGFIVAGQVGNSYAFRRADR